MAKRVFIIHGWGGNPSEPMHKWLKSELEKRNFEVIAPDMPNTEEPKIETWVDYLNKLIGELDEETFFIGHSIGCQAIMRYLQNKNVRIGGAVFIAGWFKLNNLEDEEIETAKPWLTTPLNFEKIREAINKLAVIISNNDAYNEVEYNSETFKERLGAKVIIKENMGHFTKEDNINKLPDALNEVLEMAE